MHGKKGMQLGTLQNFNKGTQSKHIGAQPAGENLQELAGLGLSDNPEVAPAGAGIRHETPDVPDRTLHNQPAARR